MTNSFISRLEREFNYKLTENGALALKSTGSKVYDLFAFGGAYRSRTEEDCILLFKNAFEEDRTLALKCLFYLRDCRGGQGERRFFRICLKWLAEEYPIITSHLIKYIPTYGRYDDWFVLFDTPLERDVLMTIAHQLTLDMTSKENGISLLAKWMPSENTSSKETVALAKKIRGYLRISSKKYRKMLSKLREKINVLESLMSTGRWGEIQFDKIPSKAGLVYRNAFARRDILAKKYEDFIKNKNTKVNAGTLYPYEIVEKVLNRVGFISDGRLGFAGTDVERAALGKFWESQPDYLEGKDCSMMCVIDTSGSMYGRPIDVAISLGLYCAERMSGPFAGKYISFASRPRLIKTEGVDFVDKVFRIYKTNLVDNTNLTAVFDLLLHTAMEKGVYADDLPKTIVVISDMEIDYGSNWSKDMINLEMENIRIKWASCGFKLPKLVYWNVNSRNSNTILDKGNNVTFVSGCSPIIFKQVLTGKTGFELMMETLSDKRYMNIHA